MVITTARQPRLSVDLTAWRCRRPAIHGRLLFWLAALHAVPGMLYWDTDLFSGYCHGNTTTPACEVVACATPTAQRWALNATDGTLRRDGRCANVASCASCKCARGDVGTRAGTSLVMNTCCDAALVSNCTSWHAARICESCMCPGNQHFCKPVRLSRFVAAVRRAHPTRTAIADHNGTDGTLRSNRSGLCLEGGALAATIVQSPCDGSDDQRWALAQDGRLELDSASGDCFGSGTPIPTGDACKPIGRVNRSMFTDWVYSPSFVAPNGQNGDGSLVYPGADGPLSSIRLCVLASPKLRVRLCVPRFR